MLSSNVYFYKNGNKKCIKKRKCHLISHFPMHFYEKIAFGSSDTKKQDCALVQQFVRQSAFQLTKCKRKGYSENNRFPNEFSCRSSYLKVSA